MYVTWKIVRIPRINDSTWDTSNPITITSYYDPLLRMSLGSGKDSFVFKQTNFNDTLDNYWQMGDKVEVYYKVNSSSLASSDILLTGIVKDVPSYDTYNRNEVVITCNNYSSIVMEALTFHDPGDSGETINTFLNGAVIHVKLNNENFAIGWSSDSASTKSDGSAFPTIVEKWYYKNLKDLLDKYSSETLTEDGNYYWYVDSSNEVVWKKKTDDVDYSFSTSSDDYKSLTIKKDTKGVINFIIAKGDLSPQGKAITVKRDNPSSRAKNGFKYHLLISRTNTAQALMDLDKEQSGFTGSGNDPTTYPFTTKWVSEDSKTTKTVSSYDDYDSAIRDEVKYRLGVEAQALLNDRAYGKLMVEIEFENGKGWSIGNVVKVTIPGIGKSEDPMRVQDVQISNSGERYTLIEDEGTIGKES